MTALALLVTLALSILVAPLAGKAQPSRQMPRIGVFAPDTPAGPWADAFRQGLCDLGYVESQTIAMDIRWTRVSMSGLPTLWSACSFKGGDEMHVWTPRGACTPSYCWTKSAPMLTGSRGTIQSCWEVRRCEYRNPLQTLRGSP